jgi:hypothetical protein
MALWGALAPSIYARHMGQWTEGLWAKNIRKSGCALDAVPRQYWAQRIVTYRAE